MLRVRIRRSSRAFQGVLLSFPLALNAVANYCVRKGCEAVI